MSWLKKFLPIGEERSQTLRFGFQVLKNTNKFIAIEPWFDFICGINGRLVEDGNSYLFSKEIENCAGRDATFTVWSAKGQRTRTVTVSVPATSLSLGLVLQWTSLLESTPTWHILEVSADSPADLAGLLPYSDYIIGTPNNHIQLTTDASLGELVEASLDSELTLWVYNHEYDVTREVVLTPSRRWGGGGVLGCVLGHGALHRIPPPLHEPVDEPGQTLFSNSPRMSIDPDDDEVFPPTEPGGLATPATSTPPPYQFMPMADNPAFRGTSPTAGLLQQQPAAARHKKAHHHTKVDLGGLDDLMKEGEQKSRELEGGSSASAMKGGLPPPPKRAGPPPPAAEERAEVVDEVD